jgi:hypothetical protein
MKREQIIEILSKHWNYEDYNVTFKSIADQIIALEQLDFSRKIFIYFAKDKTYEQTARDWNGSGEMTIDYWNLIKAKL